ncbi:chondroitin sulfate N-acetylgalactosaminyltransferase 2 [Nasonia vitripennis]|uniref:Hexosyltransferase n=1 Tax=Nasonia vitripennis TaxID=7425 RepID=A0A7M7Q1C3_NASVI|nr:chondroitin sulfate N-acetylgalactosaminyltransferase 2 [Nasonia vitripennis]XP_031780018.1 chondroitin sulfate N-acetylgalactosaminyltransferase 2 [Nasonia vitripennis]XP_031780019.1 chondroitin sulfate N-acetylgalactosaminyltransferase 2 [Nasonia vitripennis]
MSAFSIIKLSSTRRRDIMLRVLGVRLLSRLLVLVCSLSLLSLLFLSRCGFNNLDADLVDTSGPATLASNSLLEANQREEETRLEVERLTAEIRTLKLQILQLTGGPPGHGLDTSTMPNSSEIGDCLATRRQIDQAEISQGLSLNNEYELIAFSHFTVSRLYPVDLGLGKRVVEKPIGFKRKDLNEALLKAVDILNRNLTLLGLQQPLNARYSEDDFLEGLYRIEPTTGTQYEMYFRTKNLNKSTAQTSSHSGTGAQSSFTKITLMRPYAPIQFVGMERQQRSREKELIHIILPLSGRTGTFQSFMDKFVKIGLKNDRRVHLTVVYFGTEGLSEARAIMSRVLMTRGSGGTNQNLRLLALNETFSRGKGLRVGAERAWGQGEKDVLLFMCDVDVVFSARFLDRCRWNTAPGRKVYYPIVFSLYNPHVVYTLQGRDVPPETDQLVISRDTGFWRDFGYGMTCQYRSDFLRVRGFDENIVGWGGEDVTLYRKYVKSNIKVIRATDPGIFHIWHPKVCSGGPGQRLSTDQYRACIRSRALNEASHAQLGFLAFREDIASQAMNFKGSTAKKKKPPPKKEKRAKQLAKTQANIREAKVMARTLKDQT